MTRFRKAISFTIIASVLFGSLISGCAPIRYGGAPEPSFDLETDLAQLEEHFGSATSISDFYTNPSVAARNKFVDGRLVMMNIQYIRFITELTSDKQLFDSAAEMLVLSLSLAATGFTPASTKTILSAIAAGVIGSKDIVDKNFFFEKSVPALIATMDAQRIKVLVRILDGRTQALDEYSLTEALADLYDYYYAGTLFGALNVIHAEAAMKQEAQQAKIFEIGPVSAADLFQSFELALTLRSLDKRANANQLSLPELAGLYKTVRELEISSTYIESVLGMGKNKVLNAQQAITVISRFWLDSTSSQAHGPIAKKLAANNIRIVNKNLILVSAKAMTMSAANAGYLTAMLMELDANYAAPANLDSQPATFDAEKLTLVTQLEGLSDDDSESFLEIGKVIVDNDLLK